MLDPKHWIQTYTGLKFFPTDPDANAFDVRDIARALSMQCRYVGHVDRFYSVAEHSVRISREAEKRMMLEHGHAEGSETVRRVAQWGLIHDASEAYLGDVSRPLKVQECMRGYREAEARLMEALRRWLDLPQGEPQIIRALDTEILGTEARQLKDPVHEDWGQTCPGGVLPAALPGMELGWVQATAEMIYLKRWVKVFGRPIRQFYARNHYGLSGQGEG